MQNYPFYDEALALTKKLVSIPSMNNSDGGERAVADYMAAWIRELPYFKAHPDQVITQPLKNDPYDRINVVAIAFGSRSNSNETIIPTATTILWVSMTTAPSRSTPLTATPCQRRSSPLLATQRSWRILSLENGCLVAVLLI